MLKWFVVVKDFQRQIAVSSALVARRGHRPRTRTELAKLVQVGVATGVAPLLQAGREPAIVLGNRIVEAERLQLGSGVARRAEQRVDVRAGVSVAPGGGTARQRPVEDWPERPAAAAATSGALPSSSWGAAVECLATSSCKCWQYGS